MTREAVSGPRLDVWPNPASGAATISLTLAEREDEGRVAVYDVLGREVAVLHEGPLVAGGQAFRLGRATLPAGTYVVRVSGRRIALTRPLTIVR